MKWRVLIILWGALLIVMSSDGSFWQFNIIELLTFVLVIITSVIAIGSILFMGWYKRGFIVKVQREQDSAFLHVVIDTQTTDDYEIFATSIRGVIEERGNEPRPPWHLPWRNGLPRNKTLSITPGMPEAANLLRIDENTFQAFSITMPDKGWLLKPLKPDPLYKADSRVTMDIRIRGKLARRIQDWRITVSHGDPPQIESECIGNHRRWR